MHKALHCKQCGVPECQYAVACLSVWHGAPLLDALSRIFFLTALPTSSADFTYPVLRRYHLTYAAFAHVNLLIPSLSSAA
jgi:hypothetical protein